MKFSLLFFFLAIVGFGAAQLVDNLVNVSVLTADNVLDGVTALNLLDETYSAIFGKKGMTSKIRALDKTQYETAATVRFDTNVKEDIMFHDNDTVFWSHQKAFYHLQDQKVDPSLRSNSSETGSDVLNMLEKFVDSNHTNLCGSVAVVLMKRHPNETEISKLVRKLRELRIVLRLLVQEPPSGGLHPETLYDLAAKTNGFCTFVNYSTWEDNQATVPPVFQPYSYYSLNLKVSGIGSMVLPSITLTESVPMFLGISVQSTGFDYNTF
ncbi:unnamed protein product [Caenorhabditis nigoni]